MNKKAGRPTDNPKTTVKNVRFSDNDIEKLNYCVQKTGKSEAEIVRIGVDKVYKRLQTKQISDIEYLKRWNEELAQLDDEKEGIEVHNRCIMALKENEKLKDILQKCKGFIEKCPDDQDIVQIIDEQLGNKGVNSYEME